MAAPQASGGGQQEGSSGMLWIIAAFFAAIGAIWYSFKQYIVYGYFQIKVWELDFVSVLLHAMGIHRLDTELQSLHWTMGTFLSPMAAGNATFQDVVNLGQAVGEYLKFPFAALIGILALLVYVGHSTRVFKRIYSMKDLVNLEKNNWPQITPVANLDLMKEDIDKGPWAMGMTPMQFCKRYKLLEEFKRVGEGIARKDRNKIEVTLKRGPATRIFSIQLGPVWQGTNRLPPYARALFAVFAARLNADSKAAAEILRRLAISSVSKKLDYTGVDELLKKHESSKLVQKRINSHAYMLTVMAAMLEGAREDGVQASADFLWLKPLDRRMWYMLNTVGRQTPFVEVAGPFAHWVAEKEMGKRILVPMVEEATNALEIVLKEVIYRPDEPD